MARHRWWSSNLSSSVVSNFSNFFSSSFLFLFFLTTLCLHQLPLCQGSDIIANTTELPFSSSSQNITLNSTSTPSSTTLHLPISSSPSNLTFHVTLHNSSSPINSTRPSPPLDDFQTAAIAIYITPGNETNHSFQPDRALLQRGSGSNRGSIFLGEQQAVLARPHFINFTRLLMHRSTASTTPTSAKLTTPKVKPTVQRKYIFIDKTTPASSARAAKTTNDWSKRQSVSTTPNGKNNLPKTLVKVKVVEGGDQEVLLFDKTTTTSLPTSPTGLANLSPTAAEAILENILRKRQSDANLLLEPVSKIPSSILPTSRNTLRTKSPKRGGSRTTTLAATTTLAPTTTILTQTTPEIMTTTSKPTTFLLPSETTTTSNNSIFFETTTPATSVTTLSLDNNSSTLITTTISPLPTLNFNSKNLQNEEFFAEISTMTNSFAVNDKKDVVNKVADLEGYLTSSQAPPTTLISPETQTGSFTSTEKDGNTTTPSTTISGGSWKQCQFNLLHLCPRLSMTKFAPIRNKIACYGEGVIICNPRANKLCKLTPLNVSKPSPPTTSGSINSYESYEELLPETNDSSIENKVSIEEITTTSIPTPSFVCNVPLTTEYCSGTARCTVPKIVPTIISNTMSTAPFTTINDNSQPEVSTTPSSDSKLEVTTFISNEHLQKLRDRLEASADPNANSISGSSDKEFISETAPSPASSARPLSPLKIGLISALIAIGSLIVILVTIVAYISWSKLKNGKQQVSPTGNPISSFWSASTPATMTSSAPPPPQPETTTAKTGDEGAENNN